MARVSTPRDVIAAIDIGTNAARLKLAEVQPKGTLQSLWERRDAIRPGEGVFRTGRIAREVADRIVGTMKDYAQVCRQHEARVRAVATSSLRDARNGQAVRARVMREVGIDLEIISGEEEARLICLGVLEGTRPGRRSLVIDIGGGSTEVTAAQGEQPDALASLPLGTVRLTEMFDTSDRVDGDRLKALRAHSRACASEYLSGDAWRGFDAVYGSSGTVRSLMMSIGQKKTGDIPRRMLKRTVKALAALSLRQRRKHFEPSRADVIVAGAVVLEALMMELGADFVHSVDRGLRDGVLLDVLRRSREADSARARARGARG